MSKAKRVMAGLWSWVFLNSCLFAFAAYAETLPETEKKDKADNPFLDRQEELRYEDEEQRLIKDMNLTAILYSAEGARAMIDGRIVKVGDVINNKEIIEIKSEKVRFKDFLDKEYVLKMKNILAGVDSTKETVGGGGVY